VESRCEAAARCARKARTNGRTAAPEGEFAEITQRAQLLRCGVVVSFTLRAATGPLCVPHPEVFPALAVPNGTQPSPRARCGNKCAARSVGLCVRARRIDACWACAVRVARLVSAIWPSKAPYVVHPVPTSAPAHEIEVARLINRRARAVHTLVPWYRAVKVAWRLLKRAQSEFVAIGMQEERALGAVGLQVWCYQHARLCTNDVLPRQRVWRGWAERRHMRGLRSRLQWARKRDAVARRREHILHEFRFRGRLRSFKRKVKCRTFASCALRIVVFNYICRRLFGLRKARGTASPRRHA
jgi:hypothetical protein